MTEMYHDRNNLRTKSFGKRMFSAAATLLLVGAVFPAASHADKVEDYDFVVSIKTEKHKGVLDYKNSKLKDPTKVIVTYRKTDQPEDQKINYEEFWYADGKPYGQDKHHDLEIPSGDQIVVKVEHKENYVEQDEIQAATNAMVRVMVDINVHGNPITNFLVPDGSYSSIEQKLYAMNFDKNEELDVDETNPYKVNLSMSAESGGFTRSYHYNM